MLNTSKVLSRHGKSFFLADLVRSKHSSEGSKLKSLGVTTIASNGQQSSNKEYPATEQIPLPSNFEDLASTEKLEFSPLRSRDISGSFIKSYDSPQSDYGKTSLHSDDRVECYDCTGAVSLSSSMQSNVPYPFTSKGKPTHLNMPGGQWRQRQKYMSDDLNNVHHANVYRSGGTCDLGIKKGNKNMYFSLLNRHFLPFPSCSSHICYNFSLINLKNFSTDKEKIIKAEENVNKQDDTPQVPQLTRKEKLKAAIKDYGSVVLVFHVGISLISLGCCYLAVASGIDLTSIIKGWGVDEGAATAGTAAQFVVAYAIHKAMAPGRIAITITAVPFIVKKLRKTGFLKSPKRK